MISKLANISSCAKLGANVVVEAFSTIYDNVNIGDQTKVWHFSHIQSGARIGKNTTIGQNVNIANNVLIGNNVKIQNNVSVYEGVEIEDFVFTFNQKVVK